MRFTNKEILNNVQGLAAVSQKQLPVRVSYAISKNISKFESELKIYESERQKRIDKYAKKDKDGKPAIDTNNQFIISPEHKDQWEKDMQELLEIEAEVDIHKFKFSEIENLSFSAAELRAIDYMIEE